MSKARLPIPGEDVGNWGEILNDFLLVALNNDGTLKAEDIILAKANNADVVHNSGVETVSGVKTFLSTPIVPSPSAPMHAVNKTYTDAALATKANTNDLADVATSGSFLDLTDVPAGQDTSLNVLTTGTQTISGAKNFTGGLEISGQAVVATNDVRLSNTRTPSDDTVTTAKVVDAAITNVKLSAAIQATLAKADSALQTEQVSSVAGKTGVVTLIKGDVGLGSVDNTTDLAKPVSVAAQSALDAKANTADLSTVATTGSYNNLTDKPSIPDSSTVVQLAGAQTVTGAKNFTGGLDISGQAAVATNDARLSNTRTPTDNTVTAVKVVDGAVTKLKLSAAVQATLDKADSALQTEQVTSVAGKTGAVTLAKGDVGLGNVDNTADSAKPVSVATQTALDLKANTSSLAQVATTGSYSNLLDKPTIPTAGTATGTYAAGDDSRINGAVQKSVVIAKGDLLVATGSGAVTHLGVGSDGQVLLADSSQVQGVKWSSPSSNSAITRSINSVTGTTSAGAEARTDYVYILTGNYALTLPTAVGNTNRYTIKNRNSASVSLVFSGAENADGAGVTLGPNETVELVSDGVNWVIL